MLIYLYQVSICKFKFTGGERPSLEKKKQLSVDAGGNLRRYCQNGDAAAAGVPAASDDGQRWAFASFAVTGSGEAGGSMRHLGAPDVIGAFEAMPDARHNRRK